MRLWCSATAPGQNCSFMTLELTDAAGDFEGEADALERMAGLQRAERRRR
jgi:hypothetical protein